MAGLGGTGSILNILVNIEGAEKVTSLLETVGSTMLNTAVKADRMNAMMEASSGSAQQAAKNLDFVRATANKLGTDILVSTDAFARLTAATRGTALEGEQTQKIFEAVSAANSKLGGSTGDLTGMLQALSQMVSKGTVSMEELRGQLGERLPGTMKIAADAMGLTTSALIEHISKGEILAEDLLPRLAEAINQTYNDGKFDTAQANINRLTNEWEIFKQSFIKSEMVNTALVSITNHIKTLRGEMNALSGIWNVSGLSGKADVISEEMSRAVFNVERDPRIEAFKKYQTAQKEFIQEQNKLQDLENQPKKMGSTTRIDAITEQQKKINDLSRSYAEAAGNYAKFEEQARVANEEIQAKTNIKPAYVTETDKFVGDREVDKIKKFKTARDEELKANEQAWSRAIKLAESNGQTQIEITEAFEKRKLAITAEYNDKINKEQTKRDRPGIQAEKKEDREFKSMVERSRDVVAALENDYMTISGKTTTDSILKIQQLAEAQRKAEQDKVINAKLWGKEAIAAQEQLSKTIVAINQKEQFDIVEMKKKAGDQIKSYEDDLTMEIARANNDRLTELRLTHEAEIKASKTKYDKEVRDAQNAQVEISNIDRLYQQRIVASERKYTEDKMRISGGYWEKLSIKIKESYGDSGNFVDAFNNQLVDKTVNAADSMANAFVDMATSGKATWKDFAYSVIIEIEKMIAKMLVLWGIQQLVGLAGGMIGGESGGLISKSVGMSPFNGSGMYASFGSANGNAFEYGSPITAFADGGIVDRPIQFPMRKGMGLMGEAGPEAIMPLTRDSSGKLGVRTSGGSSGVNIGAINVQVSGDTKNPEQTGHRIGSALERQLKSLISQQVKNDMRPGNVLNPTKTIGGGTVLA